MKPTITMTERVESYLEARRQLGFQLKIEGQELLRFAKFADESGLKGAITEEVALCWAQLAESAKPLYRARRLEVVRTFARYQKAIEPEGEIPLSGIRGPAHSRTQPYIYTDREILCLIDAARQLRSPKKLRAETYATLIGLITCTGLRISEVLQLQCTDVDLENGVIRVCETKFHKTRLVPLHPSAANALSSYAKLRTKTVHKTSAFFSDENGKRIPYSTARCTFRKLADSVIDSTAHHRRPRFHDLRHTFACRSLLRWYSSGIDVNQRMAALSTYLGHVKVSDTYWYLSGTPELMSIVCDRFERFARGEDER
jgi:integrase